MLAVVSIALTGKPLIAWQVPIYKHNSYQFASIYNFVLSYILLPLVSVHRQHSSISPGLRATG